MTKEPPLALVKTWYELLIKADDAECRERARKMLFSAFGSEQEIKDYLKRHKVI